MSFFSSNYRIFVTSIQVYQFTSFSMFYFKHSRINTSRPIPLCSNNPPLNTHSSRLIGLGIQIVQAVRFSTRAGMYDGVHRYSVVCQRKNQSDRSLFSRVFGYMSQGADGCNICGEDESLGTAFNRNGIFRSRKRNNARSAGVPHVSVSQRIDKSALGPPKSLTMDE